jgi:glycosyltransferase involved in cell wall biosynthesis
VAASIVRVGVFGLGSWAFGALGCICSEGVGCEGEKCRPQAAINSELPRWTLGSSTRCGKIAKMAKVDVIIPAFNAANYLPAALESVFSQTFDDWQILIVDDGSTDNTAEMVAPFLDRFGSKIRFIKQNNRGVSAARNTAIQASTAEFLALLDADDLWLPCRLSESLKILAERPQAGLAYGLVTHIDAEGRLGETFEGNRRYAEGHIAPHIYMRKVEMPCATVTLRRRCIDEVGIFDEAMRATEDRDLWLRIALRYEVAFVPKVLAYYRVSPNSASADPQLMLKGQLRFINKHYGSEGCGLRSRQIAWARVYKQQAEDLKRRNRPWNALMSSLRAVALYPLDMDNPRTAGSLLLNWIRSLAPG